LTSAETLLFKQGERGQTDHTREDLRQMQTQIDELIRDNNVLHHQTIQTREDLGQMQTHIDELRRENNALQVQITEQQVASNV